MDLILFNYYQYYSTSKLLLDCRHIIAKCGHVTGGLYITLSGAPILPLSFL
jgi:hypothetical protein